MVSLEYFWFSFYTCLNLVSGTIRCKNKRMVGEFYDTLQKALTTPNSVTEKESLVICSLLLKLLHFSFNCSLYRFTSHWVLDGEHQWLIIIMING